MEGVWIKKKKKKKHGHAGIDAESASQSGERSPAASLLGTHTDGNADLISPDRGQRLCWKASISGLPVSPRWHHAGWRLVSKLTADAAVGSDERGNHFHLIGRVCNTWRFWVETATPNSHGLFKQSATSGQSEEAETQQHIWHWDVTLGINSFLEIYFILYKNKQNCR